MGLLFLSFSIAYKLLTKREKPTKFQEEQADRYFNKRSEDDGSTLGKIHTKGFSLIKTRENEYKFIKQSKLADTSIL